MNVEDLLTEGGAQPTLGDTVRGAGEPVRKSVDSTPFVVTPLNSASILPDFPQLMCCDQEVRAK